MSVLVSILIPAYNTQRWIAAAIESALGQTWPKKEIIIVDDGSSDRTLQIAKKYESKSVKVLSQENRGASAARNKAFSLAQGDFIQWLDADDLLDADKIRRQLVQIDLDPNTRILLTSRFGKFFYRVEHARFISNSLWRELAPVEWLFLKFAQRAAITGPAFLVSRRLSEVAGPWDERLSFDDDGEYFCRLVSRSEKVKFVAEAISYYRMGNSSSLSNDRSARALESLLSSLALCFRYLRSLEDSDRTRKACLRYLQSWVLFFYPEKYEILEKATALARDLGGELSVPEVSWKLLWAKRILGWKLAKRVKGAAWNAEISARKNWDRLFFMINGTKRNESGG
jgi:glycosyltransferase involved in cell wall biosynthesis